MVPSLEAASLESLLATAERELAAAADKRQLAEVVRKYVGAKGLLPAHRKALAQVSPAERPEAGRRVHEALEKFTQLQQRRTAELKAAEFASRAEAECIDVTLPGRGPARGGLHPVTQTINRIASLFSELGFAVADGPEIEDDYHNFLALNFPPHHPAREEHDTFYFGDGRLLRTHVSPVQVRYMQSHRPPLRIISPGRVFRCDWDATHSPMFHQVEGLCVGPDINLTHLKGDLQSFLRAFFAPAAVDIRLRSSYFPFTEPSIEIDIRLDGSDWLEVLGAGMVHVKVLREVGIDSEEFTGYAFGLGVERLAMLRHGLRDLRPFYDNDLQFLAGFQ